MKNKHNERLYRLNGSVYVQHNGKGAVPPELASYINNNKGEYPPFMHLPAGKVDFMMENGGSVPWAGKGPLPEAVIHFVKDNGFLPRYSDDSVSAFDDDSEDDWDYLEELEEEEWND